MVSFVTIFWQWRFTDGRHFVPVLTISFPPVYQRPSSTGQGSQAAKDRSPGRNLGVSQAREHHALERSHCRTWQVTPATQPNAILTCSSADTPFAGGTFRLIMTFEETYPNRPPQVKFVSKMFHPNVYNNGELCLDILQNRWSPTYDVMAILTSVQSLLNDPNPGR